MKLGFTVRSHTALGREMLVLASQKVRSPRYDKPSSFHNGFSVGNITNLAINHMDLTMIIRYFMRYMGFLLGIQWDFLAGYNGDTKIDISWDLVYIEIYLGVQNGVCPTLPNHQWPIE